MVNPATRRIRAKKKNMWYDKAFDADNRQVPAMVETVEDFQRCYSNEMEKEDQPQSLYEILSRSAIYKSFVRKKLEEREFMTMHQGDNMSDSNV